MATDWTQLVDFWYITVAEGWVGASDRQSLARVCKSLYAVVRKVGVTWGSFRPSIEACRELIGRPRGFVLGRNGRETAHVLNALDRNRDLDRCVWQRAARVYPLCLTQRVHDLVVRTELSRTIYVYRLKTPEELFRHEKCVDCTNITFSSPLVQCYGCGYPVHISTKCGRVMSCRHFVCRRCRKAGVDSEWRETCPACDRERTSRTGRSCEIA